jgi:hypothetical protein
MRALRGGADCLQQTVEINQLKLITLRENFKLTKSIVYFILLYD